MEKELLFLETSVICVRIRGDGSEVMTTPYQLYVDFQLHIDMGGGGGWLAYYTGPTWK